MSIAEHNYIVKPFAIEKPCQKEEVYRLFEVLPALVAHLDAEERFRFINQSWERWFDLPGRQLNGSSLQEIVGDEIYRFMRPRIEMALAGARQTFEISLSDKDGARRTFQANCVPRGDTEGAGGFYLIMSDVVDRRQSEEQMMRVMAELEQRVQERTAQLQAANRELEAFSYSVSHDLRAPLRAVRGFTEVLMEQYAGQLDARGQDFLRRVSDASSQMDRLVDDLLKLSRVSRSEIRFNPINLAPVAEEIVATLRKEEPARSVEVKIESPLPAHGDERLIRLVLDNLLRNAWKFTGKRAHAVIELARSTEPHGAFFVRDNGAGFDMAYASRLFGVFQRLHSPSDFPGSGVGLAIVQRVVNRHGGRVWAEGALNAGATFYFSLPSAAA